VPALEPLFSTGFSRVYRESKCLTAVTFRSTIFFRRDALYSGTRLPNFRKNGASYSESRGSQEIIHQMVLCALLTSCLLARLNYSLTLKVETIISFETSVNFDQTTRRHITEEEILYVFRQIHTGK
jgi:hypothetical protein